MAFPAFTRSWHERDDRPRSRSLARSHTHNNHSYAMCAAAGEIGRERVTILGLGIIAYAVLDRGGLCQRLFSVHRVMLHCEFLPPKVRGQYLVFLRGENLRPTFIVIVVVSNEEEREKKRGSRKQERQSRERERERLSRSSRCSQRCKEGFLSPRSQDRDPRLPAVNHAANGRWPRLKNPVASESSESKTRSRSGPTKEGGRESRERLHWYSFRAYIVAFVVDNREKR